MSDFVAEAGSEFIAVAGPDLELWWAKLDDIREQSVNARVQPPEMIERKSETMRRDKRLESIPFVVKRGDPADDPPGWFEMVSGHHRIRAARAAGIKRIIVLADTRDLSRSAVVAKQLAHNALQGKDDPEVVKRLFEEIDDVNLQLEAYVDPKDFDLPKAEAVAVDSVQVDFDYRFVAFAFLPSQMEAFEKLCERLPSYGEEDLVGACDAELFDRFKEAVIRTGKVSNIRSVGATVARMVKIAEEWCARREQEAEEEEAT